MNNRKHNSTNPYQGSAKRVLCVCSAGLLRSPTIANVLHKEWGHNCRSVGYEKDHALIPLDEVLIGWSDEVVCANDDAWEAVSKLVGVKGPTSRNLDIPDIYSYMQPELIDLIKVRYSEIG